MQAHASISSTNEGKEILTAKGVGVSMDVGVPDGEEGRTIVVPDEVEDMKTVVVLDGEECTMTYNIF
jgi:hypothetical protein